MQKGSKNPEMKIAGFVYERQGMPGGIFVDCPDYILA
jgi:hypothetical protein